MQFQLPIQIKSPEVKITYRDKIMLTGSCFTEHMGNSLDELKFSTLQNPNGILFDPRSVCNSLISYIENKQYKKEDLFYLNEIWNSWEHHSRFSNINADEALETINESQHDAHNFLKEADWLIITLGSSFSYRLTAESTLGGLQNNNGVANCHRAPSQWFNKHLLTIDETFSLLDTTYHRLKQFNPKIKIIFTISPVRHIRDGVIENNRSKARLIEAVHHMINKFPGLYYYPATEFVMEKFNESFIDEQSQQLMEEIKKIVIARKHKAFQPETNAHKAFLKTHFEKANELQLKFPFIDLKEEIEYFNK